MDKQLIKAYVKNWVANGMKEDVISSGKQVKKAKKIKPTTGKMTIDKMSNKERYKIIGNHYRIHDVVITQDDLNKELNLFDEATYDKTVKQVAKASKISLAQAIEYTDQVIANRESFTIPNLRYLIKSALNAKYSLARYNNKHVSLEQDNDDGETYSMLDVRNYTVLDTDIEIMDLFKDYPDLLLIIKLLVEGYNQQEIALKTGLSQPTIHRRIREIRQIIINNL
jgi:uncharacterized membrane protein